MTTHLPLIPLLVVFYQQNIPVLRCIYNGESSMLAPQRRTNPLWVELGRAVCGGGNNMRAHNERRNHSPREAPMRNVKYPNDAIDFADYPKCIGYMGHNANHMAGPSVYFRTREIVQMYKDSAPRHCNSISPVHTHGII